MMKNTETTALELLNFYQTNIEALYDQSHSRELAKVFAMDHCDRMIQFIDSQMQGWCDTDLISMWKTVKQNISKY
jgi:hypothetical protein